MDAASPLPRRISLPSRRSLRGGIGDYEIDNHVAYVLDSARELAGEVQVEERDDLAPICWSAFPVVVDGTPVVVDFSDFLLLDPRHAHWPHWLRFHYTSAFRPFPGLGAFPAQSFHDWAGYREIAAEVAAARTPDGVAAILNNQSPGGVADGRYRRRMMVRGILHYHFPDRCDFGLTPRADFWRKAAGALCYVHVPGSTENMIDRGWLQMMALGVPVVSPVVHDYLGPGGPPAAGEHYVACRDDYGDLADRVRWCDRDRGAAFAIGDAGRAFFRDRAMPAAAWRMVRRRIDAPGPAGGCIDCDLPRSGVGCVHPA